MKNPTPDKRVLVYDDEGLLLLAKQLKVLRKKKNWSQDDLANEAGLPHSQIGRIETCKTNPTVSTIFKIARALNVSPAEIFNFDLTKSKQDLK